MKPKKQRLRFSLLSQLLGLASIAFVISAFSRGNYLINTGVGTTYAVVALLIVVLIASAIRETPFPKLRLTFFVLFSILVCLAFAFPMYISFDLRSLVETKSKARDARNQLHAVFSEDSAFANLSFSTTHRKIVYVEISGTVPNRADLDRVKQTVYERCDFVEHCFVKWRIRVRSDLRMYIAKNDDAFVPQ